MPEAAGRALRRLKLQEGPKKDEEEKSAEQGSEESDEEESEEEESDGEESEEEDSDDGTEDAESSDKSVDEGEAGKGKQIEKNRSSKGLPKKSANMSGRDKRRSQQEASTSSSSSRPSTGESGVFVLDSFRAQSGLHYDLSNLAISARTTAEKGLSTAGLTLHSCSEDRENSHFIFRLRDSDLIDVRVGNPDGQNYKTPVCTCGGRPAVHGCKVSYSSCRKSHVLTSSFTAHVSDC